MKVYIRSMEVLKHCHLCHVLQFSVQVLVGEVVHTIDQGEGGEQGDPLMPPSFLWVTVHWRQCSAVSETMNECWHISTTSFSSNRLTEWGL